MKFDILIEEENNSLVFKPMLPIDFSTKNMDACMKYDDRILLKTSNSDLNLKKLYNNIIKTKNEIIKDFGVKEEGTLEIVFNITNDNLKENSWKFIKKYNEFNILIYTNTFKDIIDNLGNNVYPNLKIEFPNSESAISYKEFYNMYTKLIGIVDFVKHYNLSQLEQIMLVYDIVKANQYKSEDDDEDYSISRDLNKIISSDKIVCVGFSNLIDFILKNLDIKCNSAIYEYSNKENTGHQRNYVYIKDDKYNINGIFFLDATWDSKKNNNYLDNYRFFLKPFKYFKEIRKNENIISPNKFKILEKSNNEIIKQFDKENNINAMGSICLLNNEINPGEISIVDLIIKSRDELKDLTKKILLMYDKKISEQAFKNALYKVRKIEYINGIIDKPLNEKEIDIICDNYLKNDYEIKLLKALDLYDKPNIKMSLKEAKADSDREDLLRMKLLKIMKAKLNDLPTNDYIKRM